MKEKMQQLFISVVGDRGILNWNSVHKCLLLLIFFIFIKMLWITWKIYTLTSPQFYQYMHLDSLKFHLHIDIIEFFFIVLLLPLIYLYRNHTQAQQYLPYICIALLIGMLVFDWYSSGILAAGIIISLMSFAYLLMILFDKKIILFSMGSFLLTFIVIHLSGVVTGRFQYAPMFNVEAIGYPNFHNSFWLGSNLYFGAPPFLVGIVTLSSILNQWRNRAQFITELSQKDDLTGLYNRRVLAQQLMGLDDDRDHDFHYAILLLDLDHFKQVNDSYGHIAGDQVLKEVSVVLQQNLRPEDLLGRYGGEEFLIIIQNAHFYEVYRIAERCRQALAKYPHQIDPTLTIQVTCSIGIAFSDIGQKALHILNEADMALYEAKMKGRNQVTFA